MVLDREVGYGRIMRRAKAYCTSAVAKATARRFKEN
jgi:hypothetical protein